MDARTSLADMVPRGPRCYVGLLLGGAAVTALLVAGYAVMPRLTSHTTDGRVAALDLDSEGSLAVWVSSFTLLAAAGAALVVRALQSGTPGASPRLWLWAAACWTTLSIDESSSLHEAFKEMMTHATGERLSHDGSMWWVVAYFFILSTTGLLLLRAMRRSSAACALFVGVAGFYAVAVLCELGWLTAKDQAGVMIEEACEMLGNFCLLTAMALFARHEAIVFDRRQTFDVRSFRIPGDATTCDVDQRSGRYDAFPATTERAASSNVPQVM